MIQHPGIHLKSELRSRRTTVAELAEITGFNSKHLDRVLAGTRRISPALAVKLERWSSYSPPRLLALQAEWDLLQLGYNVFNPCEVK